MDNFYPRDSTSVLPSRFVRIDQRNAAHGSRIPVGIDGCSRPLFHCSVVNEQIQESSKNQDSLHLFKSLVKLMDRVQGLTTTGEARLAPLQGVKPSSSSASFGLHSPADVNCTTNKFTNDIE